MNKHTKLAIIIAPFLLITGYIAADYYQKAQDIKSMDEKAGRLQAQADCDFTKETCLLKKGELEIKLGRDSQEPEYLSVVSNYPLDGVTLAVGDQKPAIMEMKDDHMHWKISVPLEKANKLRLATSIEKVFFFAEMDNK